MQTCVLVLSKYYNSYEVSYQIQNPLACYWITIVPKNNMFFFICEAFLLVRLDGLSILFYTKNVHRRLECSSFNGLIKQALNHLLCLFKLSINENDIQQFGWKSEKINHFDKSLDVQDEGNLKHLQ